ncbi:hypothetical protein NO1_1169 [Candidatus Termititenax aidoneus]|uniref:Uncharacterized protein n=1 Tax=Termititenax aidoneus TaxID=2218524 RepID=A0A388TB07_TERA1|nr:hypothetical protein NO1_1169 [Candidatus Termititenax aidoneus]
MYLLYKKLIKNQANVLDWDLFRLAKDAAKLASEKLNCAENKIAGVGLIQHKTAYVFFTEPTEISTPTGGKANVEYCFIYPTGQLRMFMPLDTCHIEAESNLITYKNTVVVYKSSGEILNLHDRNKPLSFIGLFIKLKSFSNSHISAQIHLRQPEPVEILDYTHYQPDRKNIELEVAMERIAELKKEIAVLRAENCQLTEINRNCELEQQNVRTNEYARIQEENQRLNTERQMLIDREVQLQTEIEELKEKTEKIENLKNKLTRFANQN